MNPMIGVSALHEQTSALAEKHYTECNPFALHMHFNYMNDTDIRNLLEPMKLPADTTHFRLVAHCMLKYYYDRFQGTCGMVWENADGNLDLDPNDEFPKEREYWRKMSEDTSPPEYPYIEYEDPEEISVFKIRPRFFSRDTIQLVKNS